VDKLEVTFFTLDSAVEIKSFSDLEEDAIIGGGRFSKEQILDLLRCVCSQESLPLSESNLWLVPLSFNQYFSAASDEEVMELAASWGDMPSWKDVDVNPMDLAGHLLEISYGYRSNKLNHSKIWFLIE
jgi:hypothetical protein